METCPCCGGENWHYNDGWINGEPIEPAQGDCEDCHFVYLQTVFTTVDDQVFNYKQYLIRTLLELSAYGTPLIKIKHLQPLLNCIKQTFLAGEGK